MKVYCKVLSKIRNNKAKLKKVVGIVTVAVGLRYGKINSIPTSLSSNSTQHVERLHSCAEEDIQVIKKDGRVIKSGSGILISNQEISKGSNSALETRGGDERFWKFGPGSKARGAARGNGRKARNSNIFVNSFVPQKTYCQYHKSDPPLSCKPRVKLADDPFQGGGDNNQPPPENGNFDESQYKGGSSPFIDKFDYDNSDHTRENTDFSNKRRMSHSYDGHAEKCFGIQENRNKENLQKFEKNIRDYIESPETERINGSYRYETPAYHYKKPDEDLIVTVNATNNEYISARNATDFQLEKLEIDGNLGYDSRPSMSLTLRLRGPKQ